MGEVRSQPCGGAPKPFHPWVEFDRDGLFQAPQGARKTPQRARSGGGAGANPGGGGGRTLGVEGGCALADVPIDAVPTGACADGAGGADPGGGGAGAGPGGGGGGGDAALAALEAGFSLAGRAALVERGVVAGA